MFKHIIFLLKWFSGNVKIVLLTPHLVASGSKEIFKKGEKSRILFPKGVEGGGGSELKGHVS